MADEEKHEIPDFSHIEDRVERAKAKAAAMRAAKGKGDGSVPASAAAAPAAKAEPPAAKVEATPVSSGVEEDFSQITDRVARAKAKAAAMRAAKAGEAAPAAHTPATSPAGAPAAAEDRVARAKAKAEAARAAKAAGSAEPTAAAPVKAAEAPAAPAKVERKVKTGPSTPLPEFRPGVVLQIHGKNALILAARKGRLVLVYENDPIQQRIPVDQIRLEREWYLGNLEVVSVGPPPPQKVNPKRTIAFLVATGATGIFFAVTGYVLGPLGLFITIPAAYCFFGLAARVPQSEF